MKELKDFFTVKELAEALNVLPDTVRKMINDGRLHATKFNRSYIISKEEAERLIKERKGA